MKGGGGGGDLCLLEGAEARVSRGSGGEEGEVEIDRHFWSFCCGENQEIGPGEETIREADVQGAVEL